MLGLSRVGDADAEMQGCVLPANSPHPQRGGRCWFSLPALETRLQKRKQGALRSFPTSPAVFLLLPEANGCEQNLWGCLGRTWPPRAITSRKTTTGCSRAAQLVLAGQEHGDSTALKTPITFLISSLFQTVVVAYFLAKTGGGGWRPAGVARDSCLASALPSPGCLHLQHLQLLRHPPQGHLPLPVSPPQF